MKVCVRTAPDPGTDAGVPASNVHYSRWGREKRTFDRGPRTFGRGPEDERPFFLLGTGETDVRPGTTERLVVPA